MKDGVPHGSPFGPLLLNFKFKQLIIHHEPFLFFIYHF